MKSSSKALTLAEVADYFGTTVRTVRSWGKSGELRLVNISRDPASRKPRLVCPVAARDEFEARRTLGVSPTKTSKKTRKVTTDDLPDYFCGPDRWDCYILPPPWLNTPI